MTDDKIVFKPLITVIIPARGYWVPSAQTVAKQTWMNWSLVCVGKPPEGTPEVKALIADPRLLGVGVDNLESEGYADEWTMGLIASKGDIVTFLEPGMGYSPDWLEQIAELFYPGGARDNACEIISDDELRESPSRTAILGRMRMAGGLPNPRVRPVFAEWIERLTRFTKPRTLFGKALVGPLTGTEDPPYPESNESGIKPYDGWWRPGSSMAVHSRAAV